jgi:hypothetical protein
MRWTRRLKRFGGLRQIESIRVAQFEGLAKILNTADHQQRHETAKNALEWLTENPVRVLSSDMQLYFGWRNQ